MFDDEIIYYRSLSNDELFEKARMGDYKAITTLLERIMELT